MSDLTVWDGLRLLADWFDARIPNDTNPEVQASLRVWAQDFIDLHSQLAQRDERNAALEARIKELEEYKEYHEFAEGQIEYVIGEPVTTLGRMAERFEELKADLAAVAPVVRAAVEHEQGYRGSWETGPNGEGLVFRPSICGCGVCMAVCALPADVLERMGVER